VVLCGGLEFGNWKPAVPLGLRGSEIWTMEDPPARLLFRGSLRRSGGGEASGSAWSVPVGLCCRCDASCFGFRSTSTSLTSSRNCDLAGQYLSNLATLRCTLLPTPSLSQAQQLNEGMMKDRNETVTNLIYTSVLPPCFPLSKHKPSTGQGTNPEGGEDRSQMKVT